MEKIKYISLNFLLLLLSSNYIECQLIKFGSAKGLFMDLGVGPRVPVGDNSIMENLGTGVQVTFSYSDNEFLPIFLYGSVGHQHNPGRQNFYGGSDYSAYSVNLIYLNAGVRYYFSPIVENVVILMPIIEGGINWGYFIKQHEFKLDRYRNDYIEETQKFGFHIGGGFSMFLLDVVVYYNHYYNNEYISIDLRIRLPIYVSI
ncbi:MAG: hypothetical protein JXA68_09955 [Ignavibacteriales bacterium]|nr:hypothetical protein [Ignavibacteriales bacterium]